MSHLHHQLLVNEVHAQFPDRGRQWDGVLDEARVLNVVKDEHWIKLDYESRREGQKFLTFGKTESRF